MSIIRALAGLEDAACLELPHASAIPAYQGGAYPPYSTSNLQPLTSNLGPCNLEFCLQYMQMIARCGVAVAVWHMAGIAGVRARGAPAGTSIPRYICTSTGRPGRQELQEPRYQITGSPSHGQMTLTKSRETTAGQRGTLPRAERGRQELPILKAEATAAVMQRIGGVRGAAGAGAAARAARRTTAARVAGVALAMVALAREQDLEAADRATALAAAAAGLVAVAMADHQLGTPTRWLSRRRHLSLTSRWRAGALSSPESTCSPEGSQPYHITRARV